MKNIMVGDIITFKNVEELNESGFLKSEDGKFLVNKEIKVKIPYEEYCKMLEKQSDEEIENVITRISDKEFFIKSISEYAPEIVIKCYEGKTKLDISEELKEKMLDFNMNTAELYYKLKNCFSSKVFHLSIAVERKDRLSYNVRNRIHKFEGNYFENELRESYSYMVKPVKVINRILDENGFENLTQIEIDNLLGCLNKDFLDDFKEVSGSEITKLYNKDSYYNFDGTLGNSCMRYDSCYDYFGIYEDNCEMIVLLDAKSGSVKGRALLWDVEMKINGEVKTIKLMDRIYTNDHNDESKFKSYAVSKGYYFMTRQTFTHDKISNNLNEDCVLSLYGSEAKVKMVKRGYCNYPYLDTFRYLSGLRTDNQFLTVSESLTYGKCLELDSTEGDYSGGIRCSECGEELNEGEYNEIDGEIYCEDCMQDIFVYVESVDRYVNRYDVFFCDNCGEVELVENFHNLQGDSLCECCFDEASVVCEGCGESFYVENSEEIDGEIYCEDCAEDKKEEEAGDE